MERPLDPGPAADRDLMDRLFTPDGHADPQRVMNAHPTLGCRYAVVDAVLRDRRTTAPAIPPSSDAMFQLIGRFMARIDGDRHHEIRSLFSRIFTPTSTKRYEELVRARARSLLDHATGTRSFDLVASFARPLPFGVISDVLGVPQRDHAWLEATMATLTTAFANQRDPHHVTIGNHAVEQLLEFFGTALTERAQHPRDDLLTLLSSATTSANRDDVLANCVFFLLAGHATTTTLLAEGARLLSQRPHDLAELRRDPSHWPIAIEELLRFISPITLTGAGVPDDVVIGDTTFTAGANRLLCYAAANRDPAAFDQPEELALHRDPNHHLAFAVGRHHCVGAPLARLHGVVGLSELFARLPGLHVDEIRWRGSTPVRQLDRMLVSW